jgi:hypothetical protein
LHIEINPKVTEALIAKQPIPYQDCIEVYHRLADRVPNQKYVNSFIEDLLNCSTCQTRHTRQTHGRELFLLDSTTPVKEQILRYADQGIYVSTTTCSFCANKTCEETRRVYSFGDVILFSTVPGLCTRDNLPPLVIDLPPGVHRTRGGNIAKLALRSILFSCTTPKEEHHIVADVDHATDGNKLACYYDPLVGQVLGPPPDKYELTHLVYTPLGPNCAIKLPNKINESSQVPAAPIDASAGASKIQDTTKAKSQITLSLFFKLSGLAPLFPQPNQPQMPPAIKTNCRAALATKSY